MRGIERGDCKKPLPIPEVDNHKGHRFRERDLAERYTMGDFLHPANIKYMECIARENG